MSADVEIIVSMAVSPAEIDMAKSLFLAHEKELAEEVCFQDFDDEMKNLQSIYAPPAGALLLAFHKGKAVGVVGMVSAGASFDSAVAEMRRLYVVPGWRGKGIGRMLCEEIMNTARKQLYKTMRLETLSRLEAAISLYLEHGFKIEGESEARAKGDKNICVMLTSL